MSSEEAAAQSSAAAATQESKFSEDRNGSRVSVGPSGNPENFWTLYNPNDCQHPYKIDSEYFEGYLMVLVKNFGGETVDHAPPIPTNSYFDGRTRLFRITVQGRFKKEGICANDLTFGVSFASKIKLPWIAGMIIRAGRAIDESLQTDAYGEKPYFVTPLVCGSNLVRADPLNPDGSLPEWRYPSGSGDSDDDLKHLEQFGYDIPETVKYRRKFFAKPKNRSDFVFRTDVCYTFDFWNSAIDWNTMALKMFGTVNFCDYLNCEQAPAFVARYGDEVLWGVQFEHKNLPKPAN